MLRDRHIYIHLPTVDAGEAAMAQGLHQSQVATSIKMFGKYPGDLSPKEREKLIKATVKKTKDAETKHDPKNGQFTGEGGAQKGPGKALKGKGGAKFTEHDLHDPKSKEKLGKLYNKEDGGSSWHHSLSGQSGQHANEKGAIGDFNKHHENFLSNSVNQAGHGYKRNGAGKIEMVKRTKDKANVSENFEKAIKWGVTHAQDAKKMVVRDWKQKFSLTEEEATRMVSRYKSRDKAPCSCGGAH